MSYAKCALLGLSLLILPCCIIAGSANTDQRQPVLLHTAAKPTSTELTNEAMRIHQSAIVIDGHNDLPWKIREDGNSSFEQMDIAHSLPDTHTDIPRLRQGNVGAQFWSAWVPPHLQHTGGAKEMALEQIDLIHRMADYYPEVFEMAYTADDVVRIHRSGKIASLIGVEGGHTIENSLEVLRDFYRRGVRYLTLTHTETIDWADSSTDTPRHGGLSEFGEEVIREMNRLGMLVDISHVSFDTMHDVLRISKAPIIASHSSAYALARHPRNIPDDILQLIKENDGVVMVNFFSGFVHPKAARIMEKMFEVMRALKEKYPDEEDYQKARKLWRKENPFPRGTVGTVVDHIDHIVKIAGIDHVGLGSDYDGITIVPEQLEDVSCFPFITQELLNRGYSEVNIHKILGGNVLRAMRGAEQVARSRS